MVVYMENSGYEKLNSDRKKIINKASEKLSSLLNLMGKEYNVCCINNPVIHDSYGDFYMYKYLTKSYSVRILYRYIVEENVLEIHKFHFKKGDRDNSKYIEYFEDYVKRQK